MIVDETASIRQINYSRLHLQNQREHSMLRSKCFEETQIYTNIQPEKTRTIDPATTCNGERRTYA